MAVPSRLVWLLLGGGIACGARTGLEVPDQAEGGGGSELGGGWTMAVAEDTGAMSSAVIVRTGGFVLFGNCTSS